MGIDVGLMASVAMTTGVGEGVGRSALASTLAFEEVPRRPLYTASAQRLLVRYVLCDCLGFDGSKVYLPLSICII
jgi:hypothetical protein